MIIRVAKLLKVRENKSVLQVNRSPRTPEVLIQMLLHEKKFIIIIFMRNNSKKEIPKGPQCTVCLERTVNSSIDGCQHQFCLRCIKKWSRTKNNCPLCRERFLKIQTKNRVIEVEPVPQRVRPQRPPNSPPRTQQRSMIYMPMLVYPQPNCIFYPSQQGFFIAPGVSGMSSMSYPMGAPSFFIPQA